jgi:hypothetical protein
MARAAKGALEEQDKASIRGHELYANNERLLFAPLHAAAPTQLNLLFLLGERHGWRSTPVQAPSSVIQSLKWDEAVLNVKMWTGDNCPVTWG